MLLILKLANSKFNNITIEIENDESAIKLIDTPINNRSQINIIGYY